MTGNLGNGLKSGLMKISCDFINYCEAKTDQNIAAF